MYPSNHECRLFYLQSKADSLLFCAGFPPDLNAQGLYVAQAAEAGSPRLQAAELHHFGCKLHSGPIWVSNQQEVVEKRFIFFMLITSEGFEHPSTK